MVGTFWGQKSLKALSNKVFRFIQQTLGTGKSIKKNLLTTDSDYQWSCLG